MALPTSGSISSLEAYQEYYGDGATPSGAQDLDALAVAFNMTANNTDGFAGKGRPEVRTDPATSVFESQATLNGNLLNDGSFFSDVQFRWNINAGVWNYTGADGASEGAFSEIITYGFGNGGDTVYFQAMARNECNGNNWVYGDLESFTIPF